jgi:transcriptional repressor NrdR
MRRPLHHLRARAIARAYRDQEGGTARAVRPRERPVEAERVERMVTGIVRRLESMGENEIPSNVIGELVMQALSSLDKVAYIRFASVYKNFREAKDFEAFVGELSSVDRD